MIANGALGAERYTTDGISRYKSFLDSTDLANELQMDNEFFLGDGSEDVRDECFLYITNTLPVGDTYSPEGVLETQVVDPTAETQPFDDDADDKYPTFKFSKDLDADVVADKAEADYNAKNNVDPVPYTELPILDSTGNPGGKPVVTEGISFQDPRRQDENSSGTSFDKCKDTERQSGSIFRDFASIRVASVRASGLAAEAKKNLRTSSSNSQYHGDRSSLSGLMNFVIQTGGEVSPSDCERTCERMRISDKCKVKSTTVRKLFREDDLSEVGLSERKDNSGREVGIPKLRPSDCLMGLGNFYDHEPGELSQSRALELVDKLINLNAFEVEKDFYPRFQMTETMKIMSCAKGCRDLAQNSALRQVDGVCEIFHWDEKCKDDSGADSFVKENDLFFGDGVPDRKCVRGCMKPMGPRLGGAGKYAVCGDTKKDFPDIKNVGLDTQIAVEAMENLCNEVHLTEAGSGVSRKGANYPDGSFGKCQNGGNTHPKYAEKRKDINSGASIGSSQKRSRRTSCIIMSKEASKKKSSDASVGKHDFKTTPVDRKRKVTAKCWSANVFSISKARSPGPCTPKQSREGFFEKSRASNADVVDSSTQGYARFKRSSGSLIDSSNSQENHLDQCYSSDVTPSRQNIPDGRSKDVAFQCTASSTKPSISCKERDQKAPDQMISKNAKIVSSLEYSTRERFENSPTACTSFDDCFKNVNDVSPICMGDEYFGPTSRKRSSKLSLKREFDNLAFRSTKPSCEITGLRKRREIAQIRVLFSQHLDVDVIKHQKKILTRLGGKSVSSISDATHFVADEFVRTRNMLEAIACGKPVVTHLWIESCGQANCLIDEKNYILRDAKKEKQFGFCLPASLARACQHPLLQGRKVLITPNANPDKDILAKLVKAVGGLPVERLGRSVLKDEKLVDDLLILSCSEDYDVCVPFLEIGATVYSTELLLNGIVKQTLEYERHRLYDDKVKRTRSTLWMKTKDGYLPVNETKRRYLLET